MRASTSRGVAIRGAIRNKLVAGAAAIAASSILLVSALPVAATHFRFLTTSFADGSVRGIVLISGIGTDTPQLRTGVIGLPDNAGLSLNFRSIGCGGVPKAANLVYRATAMADGDGDLFIARKPSASINFGSIRSMTIVISVDFDPQRVCASVAHTARLHVATGDFNADGALGIVASDPDNGDNVIVLVEKLANDRARLTIVVDPHDPSGNTYVVSLANRACGQTPTKIFKVTFENVASSRFRRTTVDMTQNQLDALRSVRLRDVAAGTQMCSFNLLFENIPY